MLLLLLLMLLSFLPFMFFLFFVQIVVLVTAFFFILSPVFYGSLTKVMACPPLRFDFIVIKVYIPPTVLIDPHCSKLSAILLTKKRNIKGKKSI